MNHYTVDCNRVNLVWGDVPCITFSSHHYDFLKCLYLIVFASAACMVLYTKITINSLPFINITGSLSGKLVGELEVYWVLYISQWVFSYLTVPLPPLQYSSLRTLYEKVIFIKGQGLSSDNEENMGSMNCLRTYDRYHANHCLTYFVRSPGVSSSTFVMYEPDLI